MPELPEVETVRAILSQILTGKTIAKVTLIRPKNCATDPKVFVHDLVGQTFLKVTRKGKLLALHLTRDLVVVSHLRMEGKYFEAKVGDPLSKFDLVIYDCTDGTSLRYNDVRKFGVFGLYNESNYLSDSGFAALGKEPFDLTPTELYKGFQKMASKSIKEALLDQSLIAGIGNIYDNEILFACGINPKTLAKDLDIEQCAKILKESDRILKEAIALGGATVRSYHPAHGVDGSMQNKLLVYSKENTPCPKCGMPLRKIFLGQRGTVYCPHCQPYKGHPYIVAVTGPIHAGKSTVAGYLENKGYHRIDADKLVGELYKKPRVQKHVAKLLGPAVLKDDALDKGAMSQVLASNKAKKKKLEAYIHPLVYQETLKRIAAYQEGDKVVLDVPLLFGSGLDGLADTIILVLAEESARAERLTLEGKDAKKGLNLNQGWPVAEAKQAASLVIYNNGTIYDLEKYLDTVQYL